MSFEIVQQWNESFPKITKPEVVGYFSLNGKREYLPDLSQLKYLHLPQGNRINFNLNDGMEKVIRRQESASNENINNLLKWILVSHSKIQAPLDSGRWLKPEFVSYRGLLSALWKTPFEEQDGWIICAAKFEGTIYLCAFDTEEAKKRKANETPREKMMCSWGYKFEQFTLTDTPEKKPNTSEAVNENEEFCTVFTCEFGGKYLLYGAEMDGIESWKPVKEPVTWKNINFVELKTNRIIETGRQDLIFRKKLLKWWCQSFLVGIEHIVCGFRTNNGNVIDLKKYKVSDLIKMAKNNWEPSPCMNFGDAFLNHVKKVVTKDYDKCIYKFSWNPGNNEVDLTVLNSQHPSSYVSQFTFLPQWFIDKANESMRN